MTLQEHYNAIKNGKGNKAQFLKQARYLFPEYVNQYSSFDSATNVLKSKQIISEAAGGVVSKGFDIWDWKKILETKSVEKQTSKEVTDKQAHAYDNKDMKNADNINFNEIMKGFYCELRDEKNNGKTGDELKDIVVKNLAKDPLYYTKNGEFGTKGLGYTDEAPGLGTNTQPTSKEATVLGGNDKVDSDSDIVKNSLVGSAKKNVKDTLSDSESKDSMPKKVKEMPDKGVTGTEKKVRLKEEEIKWERQSLNENVYVDLASAVAALGGATAISAEVKQKLKAAKEKGKDELTKLVNQLKGAKKKSVDENYEILDQYLSVIDSNDMDEDTAYAYLEDQGLDSSQINSIMNYAFPQKADKDIPGLGLTEEQKLRSLIQQIIKEELKRSSSGASYIKINGKTVKTYTQNGDKSYNVTYDDGTKDKIAVSNDAWDEINTLHMNATNEELKENKYAKSFLDAIKPAELDINADPESSEFTDLEDAAYHFIQSTDIEGLRPEKLVYDARAYAETDLDNRLQAYVENEMSKQDWKSVKNYYLEMTQDKPEPKKAYFKLVDGILKKHGY